MIGLVQLQHAKSGRSVAVVNGDKLQLVKPDYPSAYDLALGAIRAGVRLADFARQNASGEELDYDPIYNGSNTDWRLLPAFDHPHEPNRCLVSGTGLTHKGSAENRQAMHAATAPMSDSMKMYKWGLEGGRPDAGCSGVQPEWFYKGPGTVLRAHGQALDVPAFADDGGEEAEVAGVYIIDDQGKPCRLGMVVANEFSDHEMEEKNYLYLAPSKLRTCSIGPELIVDPDFSGNTATAAVLRNGEKIWSTQFATGEANMCHSVANLEHHQFKYAQHCRPGDAHVYFFGTDAFSFGEGIRLQDGDVMEVSVSGFGRPLRNPIKIDRSKQEFVAVRQL